jgi:asparagine N-glycosylation enzyme membrane subunit Stt3
MSSPMPSHVVWFERLMYGAAAAGLCGLALLWQRAEEQPPLGVLFLLFLFTVIVVGVLVTLIRLAARQRRNWARYAICGLYLVSIPHFMRQALGTFRGYPLEDMLAWAQFLMLGAACILIFTGNARAWFVPPAPASS